jgi:hypothetical protein
MKTFARPLVSHELVEIFLQYTLQLDVTTKSVQDVIPKIVNGELGVARFSKREHETLYSPSMREIKYREDDARWHLRNQIVEELLTINRLDNDEKIALKRGGALPNCGVRSEKQAFILIGLPASGKSGISAEIAEDYGAIVIDSDFVKRKLPEFRNYDYGASIVHEESSQITTGFEIPYEGFESLYAKSIGRGYNIIYPTIGNNPKKIVELASNLAGNMGYDVHLILVSLPKVDATVRAINRYKTTKRYVPLGLIFDYYGNDPSHCYFYLRCKHEKLFKSAGIVSTKNSKKTHVDCVGESPVLKYEYENVILRLP